MKLFANTCEMSQKIFFFVTEWVVCLAPAKHACLNAHAYEHTGVQPHMCSWVSVSFILKSQSGCEDQMSTLSNDTQGSDN